MDLATNGDIVRNTLRQGLRLVYLSVYRTIQDRPLLHWGGDLPVTPDTLTCLAVVSVRTGFWGQIGGSTARVGPS